MAYRIEQIHFIEVGNFDYRISYMYDGNNLETVAIPKPTLTEDVIVIIRSQLDDFEQRRAKSNYDSLVSRFEGKSADI